MQCSPGPGALPRDAGRALGRGPGGLRWAVLHLMTLPMECAALQGLRLSVRPLEQEHPALEAPKEREGRRESRARLGAAVTKSSSLGLGAAEEEVARPPLPLTLLNYFNTKGNLSF